MGPGIASGPHSRLLARVRFGDCHSGWEVAKGLRVSRIPGIAARCARLPGYRLSRLRVSTGLSPQPFRWSKRTGNHRSHRFTGVRSLFLRAGTGCDRIARGRTVGLGQSRSLTPAPLLRIPERRIRTAFPLPFGVVRTWPKPCPSSHLAAACEAALAIRSRRTPNLFSRVPKTAFGRLAYLDRGPHRLQKFALLFKDLRPDLQPLFPLRPGEAAPTW